MQYRNNNEKKKKWKIVKIHQGKGGSSWKNESRVRRMKANECQREGRLALILGGHQERVGSRHLRDSYGTGDRVNVTGGGRKSGGRKEKGKEEFRWAEVRGRR